MKKRAAHTCMGMIVLLLAAAIFFACRQGRAFGSVLQKALPQGVAEVVSRRLDIEGAVTKYSLSRQQTQELIECMQALRYTARRSGSSPDPGGRYEYDLLLTGTGGEAAISLRLQGTQLIYDGYRYFLCSGDAIDRLQAMLAAFAYT